MRQVMGRIAACCVCLILGVMGAPTSNVALQAEELFAFDQISFLQVGKTVSASLVVNSQTQDISITVGDNQYWSNAKFNDFVLKKCGNSPCVSSVVPDLLLAGVTQCTDCLSTEFEESPCTPNQNRVCTPCTGRGQEEYRLANCTATSDSRFAACLAPCPGTKYQTVPCTESSNRVCELCTTRGANQYLLNGCQFNSQGQVDVTANARYANCDPCKPGDTFETIACGSLDVNGKEQNRECSKCSACQDKMFIASNCTVTDDTLCAACSSCAADSYLVTPCSRYADTKCQKCTTCAKGIQFKTNNCTATTDTVCQTCRTTCPLPGHYISTECSETADIECKPCSEKCPPGFYAFAQCSAHADLDCRPCESCAADYFLVANCTATSNTQCSPCSKNCGDWGYKVADCTNTTDITCKACTNCTSVSYPAAKCTFNHDTMCSLRGTVGSSKKIDYHDLSKSGSVNIATTNYTFYSPVIVATPPSFNEQFACVPRVESYGTPPSGYRLWIAEPLNGDVFHVPESVGWLVLDSGASGNHFVGTVTATANWTSVTLPDTAKTGTRPWIFSFVQSTKNGASADLDYRNPPEGARGFAKPRITLDENSKQTFKVKIEADAISGTKVESETVGFFAIDSGCLATQTKGDSENFANLCTTQYGSLVVGGIAYEYALGIIKTSGKNMALETITFGKTFKEVPIVLANIQTYLGSNPAELRTFATTTTQYQFLLEEDTTTDIDTSHPPEWVAWLALGNF